MVRYKPHKISKNMWTIIAIYPNSQQELDLEFNNEELAVSVCKELKRAYDRLA